MTPFQVFRLWTRRAPTGERAFAAVAAAVVVVLLTWVVIPSDSTTGAAGGLASLASAPSTSSTAPAATANAARNRVQAGQSASTNAATPAAAGTVGSDASAAPGTVPGPVPSGGVATSRTTASGCVSPPGSAPGVTDREIKVAVMIPDIAGPAANGAFGVPPTSSTKKWYQDVIDDINAAGGIACRKIVPLYYNVNPADQSDLQQKCLDVVQAGVFATLDEGGYGPFPEKDCYAQHHIPFFTGYPITEAESRKFYPYMFANSSYEGIYRNTAFALRDRGFFSAGNGFGKLGFIYNSCYPYLIDDMTNWLHQAGVPADKIVPYDFGWQLDDDSQPVRHSASGAEVQGGRRHACHFRRVRRRILAVHPDRRAAAVSAEVRDPRRPDRRDQLRK